MQVEQPKPDEYSYKIGFHVDLSPRAGEFVVCIKAAEGLYQDSETGTFSRCQDLFPGCEKCTEDGTECSICEPRHMSYMDANKQKCKSCNMWSDVCNACNANDGCIDCDGGYWQLATGCFKKPW